MKIRVLTLPFSEAIGGFSEQPLEQALVGQEILSYTEYYFEQNGRPWLTLVCKVAPVGQIPRGSGQNPEHELDDAVRELYGDLKAWRNKAAQENNSPSYTVFKNSHLVQICKALPDSLGALRAINGIGEKKVALYGAAVLEKVAAFKAAAKATDNKQKGQE